ncbi:MAG: DUF3987 domain-containing protein [Bacteroidales bacterium]|nr:DUF3987 domain-containing protein [Bacteroidales bacterium]MDD3913236.1 DUF3987 domain-containing protein [Bacteroidales bacterium]MDD4633267.1 DUF3987 domain-containing protein [Bacteroidales bacterium]
MSKKKFNPKDWVTPTANQSLNSLNTSISLSFDNEIETITKRIESAGIDITPNYADWRDLGFALADALGESGRNYYHRLSRFYPNYNQPEADKQYNNCLKAHGHGVTIKTLYHLAKQAGIEIAIQKTPQPKQNKKSSNSKNGDIGEIEDLEEKPLPTIPETVYHNLPDYLKRITAKATSHEDKDLLLLGSLVAISPCLPNIYGVYAERNVYPNLFLFVTAQASAGKGRLTLCRKLVEPIHRALREQSKAEQQEYQRQLTEYTMTKDKTDMERPQEPPLKMLIIPANNSATGLFQILNDNKGIGLIFETEGDTLAQTFKSEHGNYSDGFRKAFHHEIISYNRRKDREFVELETPRLSALLSGTPKQVSALIPNAENGLFSRFIFYYMNILPVWKDVFAGDDSQTLDDYFRHLGNQFFDFYKTLQQQSEPLRFCLTATQQQAFNAYFSQAQNQYLYLCGVDYLATVRRLGLITFRIAMILTALRIMETGHITSPMICDNTDFSTALELVKILIQHAARIYETLPTETEKPKQPNQKQQFLETLPPEFSRKDYLATAKKLNIPDKTAEKHIARFVQNGLISHFAHDKYRVIRT